MKPGTTKEKITDLINEGIEELFQAYVEDMSEEEIQEMGEDTIYELVSSDAETLYQHVRLQLEEDDTDEFNELFEECYNRCS